MSHGPTRIRSKGSCIYCGRSGLVLTDEHIMPLFMGGKHIIEKASCFKCSTLTSKFEMDVARKLWGDARNSYDAPSRRKGKRPSHITLDSPDAFRSSITIPYSEYPAPMVFYRMGVAGILAGFPKDLDRSKLWTMETIMDEKKKQNFLNKYPGRLTFKFTHVPDSFGRMLAKIGYGQVLCTLDPQDFDPICLPYILGKDKNVSHIVGASAATPPPSPNIGYEMGTHCFGDSNTVFLAAEIRLVANNYTPVYHVVVGKVEGFEKVMYIKNKLEAVGTTISMTVSVTRQMPEDRYHWLPNKWPITPE
jgi:hypothetical protein